MQLTHQYVHMRESMSRMTSAKRVVTICYEVTIVSVAIVVVWLLMLTPVIVYFAQVSLIYNSYIQDHV